MNLLAPAALWLSLVGAAVVALYLLKIKRQRQSVPSLEFWLALAGKVRARSLFQRLKRWLSLMLWLLIVGCLVLAIGNPILSLGSIKPRSIAVILDNSASMQTIEDTAEKRTRWHAALAALQDALDRRPVDDQWLLIEAARQPTVRNPWTRDRRAIRESASEIAAHRGTSFLSAARDLAADLLSGMTDPLIVVISDGAAGDVAKLPADSPPLVHLPVGKANDNLGITLLRVRAERQQASHFAHLRLVNSSLNEVKSQVVLALDSSTVAVEPFAVAAGATWEKTLSFIRPEGAVLRATIDRADALSDDNDAVAVLPPMKAARVRLVSDEEDAFFFERALVAMEPLVDAAASETVSPEEYANAASLPPVDLTIFNKAAPAALPPSGAFVFVNDWPTDLPAKNIGELDAPSLSLARRDHPLTQHLSLGAVKLAAAREVTLTDSALVLADSATGTPLIFLIQQPDRFSLCLAFDVLESDLPFRNAFPILLRNAILHLVSEQSAWIRDQYAIGDSITPLRALPENVKQIAVARAATKPGETIQERTLDTAAGGFRFDDTAAVAAYRFTIGDDLAFAAVNLTSESESRIAPTPATAPDVLQQHLPLSGRLFSTSPWLALAILGTVLIGFEWLSYHLRWTE